MISARGEGQPAVLIPIKRREEQYTFLANTFLEQRTPAAVLYRNNDSAIPIADLLIRKNISFALNKELRNEDDNPLKQFFDNQVVKDIRCFLKLTVDPYDTEAFMQIYYKLGYGFKKNTAYYTSKLVKQRRMSVFDALIEDTKDYPSIQRKAYSFSDFFVRLRVLSTYEAISKLCEQGYNDYMEENDLDPNKAEILRAIAISEPDVGKFLVRLENLPSLIRSQIDRSSPIVLSTIHSAKGLEYDTVYLLDIFDDILPKDPSAPGEDYMEERRLFYVAMTRAKNALFMFHSKTLPSAFVEEIFPNKTAARLKKSSDSMIKKKPSADFVSRAEYKVGDRVEIKSEGIGTITEIEEREFVSLGLLHMITVKIGNNETQKALEILIRENRISKVI